MNSSSACSICLLACFLASSAYAFSATAILSCSRASSSTLSPNHFSLMHPFSNDPIDNCNCAQGFPSLLLPVPEAVESWSSRLGWSLFTLLSLLVCAVVVLLNKAGSTTVHVSGGFGTITPICKGAPVLKLFSLEGLEAVRDKHTAAACTACVSGPNRPTLHASWCSIKLSTLQTILRGHKESFRTFWKAREILPCKSNKKKLFIRIKVLGKEVKGWGRCFSFH